MDKTNQVTLETDCVRTAFQGPCAADCGRVGNLESDSRAGRLSSWIVIGGFFKLQLIVRKALSQKTTQGGESSHPDDLELRTFEERDMDEVMEIEKACFPDPIPRDEFLAFKSKSADSFVVALEGNCVVGYVILEPRNGQGHLVSIGVDPSYRKKGIGEALLSESIHRYAGKRGIMGRVKGKKMYVEVRPSNKASIALARKLLFKETGRVKRRFYPDGEDGIVMERVIR